MTSALYPSGSVTYRAGGNSGLGGLGAGTGTGSARAFASGYPGKAPARVTMPFHAALQPLGEAAPALVPIPPPSATAAANGRNGVPALNLTRIGSSAAAAAGGGGLAIHTAPLQPLPTGLTPVPPPVPRGSETDRTAGYHGSSAHSHSRLRPARRPGADAQSGLTPLASGTSAAALALAAAAAAAPTTNHIAPGVGPLPHFTSRSSGGGGGGNGVNLPSLSSPLAPPLSDPVGHPPAGSNNGRRDSASGSLAHHHHASGSGSGSSGGGGGGGIPALQLSDPLLAILEKQPVRLMAAGNHNPQPAPSAASGADSPNGEVAYTPGILGAGAANDRYATVNIHSAASTLRHDLKTDQHLLQGLLKGGGGLLGPGGKEDPLLAAARAKAAAHAAAEAAETRDERLPTSPRNTRSHRANGSTGSGSGDSAPGSGTTDGLGSASAAGAAPATTTTTRATKRSSGSKSKTKKKSTSPSRSRSRGPTGTSDAAAEWLRELEEKQQHGGGGGGAGPSAYRKSLPEHTHVVVTFGARALVPLSTGLFAKEPHARCQLWKFHKHRATVSDSMWKQIAGATTTDAPAGTGAGAGAGATVAPSAYGAKIVAHGDELYARVWESDVATPDTHANGKAAALAPTWKQVVLSAAQLCDHEPLRPLLVRVWNVRDASQPEFWCQARTTWAQLSGALASTVPALATTASGDAKPVPAPAAADAKSDTKAAAATAVAGGEDTKHTAGGAGPSGGAGPTGASASAGGSASDGKVRVPLQSGDGSKVMGEFVCHSWSQIAQRPVGAVFGKGKKRTTDTHVQVRLRLEGHDVTSRGWSKDSPYVQLYVLIKPGDDDVLPQLKPNANAATSATDKPLTLVTRAAPKKKDSGAAGADESWALVYTSPVCPGTDAPAWPPFTLPLAHMCCLSLIRAIRVVVRHAAHSSGQPQVTGGGVSGSGVVGSDPVIGEATTSLKRLLGVVGDADDDDGTTAAAAAAAAAADAAAAAAGADAKAAEQHKKTPVKSAPAPATSGVAPVLLLINDAERVKRPKEYTPNGSLRVVECLLFYDGERAKNLPPPPPLAQATPTAPTGPPPSGSVGRSGKAKHHREKSTASAAAAAAAIAAATGDTSAEPSVSVHPSASVSVSADSKR